MECLILLTEKNNGILKARTCAKGCVQRGHCNNEEKASLTVVTDSILIMGTIEVKQRGDILMADLTNIFVQTEIPPEDQEEKIIIKIRSTLTNSIVS